MKIDLHEPVRRKRAVIWNVAGSWLSNLIFAVQGFLLIPLYIIYLGDRLYGFWLATGGVLAWLAMVDVGAAAVTQQRCAAAYGKKDIEAVVAYFWHGAVVIGGVLIAFALALAAAVAVLPGWLGVDPEYRELIVACFALAGVGALGRLANDFMRYFAAALQRNQIPVFARALGDLIGLVSIIVFLVFFDLGLWSLAIGAVLRSAVPFVINIYHTAAILRAAGAPIRWSRRVFRDYFRTTPSVLFAKATGTFSQHLPAVLITRFIGPEATVIYTVTIKLIQVVQSFINQALGGLYAACSHYFHDPQVSGERKRATVAQLTQGYIVGAGVGVLLYAILNQGFISVWAESERFGGQAFVCFMALASFLNMRNSFFVGIGISLSRINEVEVTRAFENITRAVLAAAGIYWIGIIGAPLSMLIATVAAQIPYAAILRRADGMVASALRPLFWAGLPVAVFLVAAYPAAAWFDVGSWVGFFLVSLIAGVPLGVVFVLGMPGFKDKVVRFASGFGLHFGPKAQRS